MRKKYPSIIRVLVVLAMVVTLTGVLAIAPVSAQTVTLSDLSAPVGTAISVTVDGYASADEGIPVSVKFDGAALATQPVAPSINDEGKASAQFAVPAAVAGPHFVTVVVGLTEENIPFNVEPKVTISPKKGPVGTSATVKGTGFSAGVTASITVGGKALASGVLIDIDGNFEAIAPIPTVEVGPKEVNALDGAGVSASADGVTATFTVTPTLTVSPTSGLSGIEVKVTGRGWNKNDTVTLNFAGDLWGTVNTDGFGEIIPGTLVVEGDAQAGIKSVQGTDTDSPANTAVTTFEVLPRPLTIEPSSGPKGTTVMITGSSLTPGSGVDGIATGNLLISGEAWNTGVGAVTGAIDISSQGVMFPTRFVVPNLPEVTVGVNAAVAIDSEGLQAIGMFEVTKPTVKVTPVSAPRGAPVTITGAGWVPNKPVFVDFTGADYTQTAYADANGNIAVALNVPGQAVTGPYNQVTVTDTMGNVANPAIFTVPGAFITVNPAEGRVLDEITVTGKGFQGYSWITVEIASGPLGDKMLSNAFGEFTLTAIIPGVQAGSRVIEATDGPRSATTFFIVKAAAETVETALASIMDKVVIVWDYAGGDWLFYDPNDEGSDLTGLEKGSAYWIKVTEDVELIYGTHSYMLTAPWYNFGWLGL